MGSTIEAMAMHVLLAQSMLAGGTVVYDNENEWMAGHDMTGSSTSSAIALSFPLHRLEPYCTCVWLDPLVIASGPNLPPMQALPMSHDGDAAAIAVEAPSDFGGVAGPHAGGTAAYVLSSEPTEMDRQNVADRKDGARACSSVRCRESKNADHLLSVDSFSFMRNDCSADKWVAIKLSQSIKLTAVDISMLELYSSRVKTFDLYVSATKPVKTDTTPWQADMWTHVATMKLENKKGQQAQHFSKFLLLHFTSQFGTEPVCTINTFRAFGITEAEDLEEQLSALQGSTHDVGVQESPDSPADADTALDSTPPDAADEIDTGNKQASGTSQHKHGDREGVSADKQRRVKPENAARVPSSAASRGAAGRAGHSDANENNPRRVERVAADTQRASRGSVLASHPSEPGHASRPDSGQQDRAAARSRDSSATHNKSDHAVAARPGKQVASKNKPAPQVLPHVFNEAVAVAVNGAGGIANAPGPAAVSQPPAQQGNGAAAEDVEQWQHVSYEGPQVTQATSFAKPMADRQRKQGSTAGPRRSDQSLPQRSHWKPSAATPAAYGSDKQRKTGSARRWAAASGSHDENHPADQRRHEEAGGAAAGSPGARQPAAGAATADAKQYAGHAQEKAPKASAIEPLHDTAAPSKAGAASVYDLIKKELVALKVETSTLGKSMKQAAPQAALQEAVRRHAETEAKLSMVRASLLALEARLDGLATVQQEDVAAHLEYLQVAYGILALTLVVCLATVLFSVWVMCRQIRLHRETAGYIARSVASHETGAATACAPPQHSIAPENRSLGIRERMGYCQLEVQGRTTSHLTPRTRPCAARIRAASGKTAQTTEREPPTSAWSPDRVQSRSSDSQTQAGSVHVIRSAVRKS